MPEYESSSKIEKPLTPGEQDWLEWLGSKPPEEVARMLNYQSERGRLAGKDSLTELKNRDGIYLLLPLLRAEATREHCKLSVVMVDLDNLKKINDECGHKKGDEKLIETARRLEYSVREVDIVGRWGGDEFVIVGLVKGEDGARTFENKIRLGLKGDGVKEEINASCGSFEFEPDADFGHVLDMADARMYQEKQAKTNLTNGK